MEKRGDQKETPTETNARLLAELKQELGGFKQQMDAALGQLFGNQEAMKGGLDSAEVNLRAFQKVINGQVEGTLLLLPVPEQHPMSEVPPPLAKINWPEYYALVDAEMKAMEAAAHEMELQKTKTRLKVLVEDKKLEWLKERILGQIDEQRVDVSVKAQQKQNAAKFFATAQLQIDRAQKGEGYDTNRLDQLLQMISVAERKEAEANTPHSTSEAEPPAEALGRLADEDSDHNGSDGDTVVFGGDVPVEHEADCDCPAHQAPKGTDGGG